MSIEMMLFIAVVLIIVVIILWPMLKKQPPAKQYPHRQARGVPMTYRVSGLRFGQSTTRLVPATNNDPIVDGSDADPAVIAVAELALRAGHELVESLHQDLTTPQTRCTVMDQVDATGEPVLSQDEEQMCRVERVQVDVAVTPLEITTTPMEADRQET